MTMGTAATIKITPPVSGATSTITYKFGSASGTIVTKTSAASVRWTPPTSLAAQIPNSASGTGTLTVETYSGATKLGSRAYTVTISVPSTMTPTLTVALSDPTGRADTYGGYIQSKSRLKVELTAAGVQGSTVKSYAIKVGDILSATSDTATSGYLPPPQSDRHGQRYGLPWPHQDGDADGDGHALRLAHHLRLGGGPLQGQRHRGSNGGLCQGHLLRGHHGPGRQEHGLLPCGDTGDRDGDMEHGGHGQPPGSTAHGCVCGIRSRRKQEI